MRAVTLLAIGALLATGCFSRLDSQDARHYSCSVDGDCREGWKCGKAKFCFNPATPARLDCEVDEHCPVGFLCGLDQRCFDTDAGEPLRCVTHAHCGGGWRCGLNGLCYDRQAAGAIPCRVDAGEDLDATECAATWRCGLEGLCHARDAGAAYLCEDDTDCEAQWRCGLENRCVDTADSALRDRSITYELRPFSPEASISLYAPGDETASSSAFAVATTAGLFRYTHDVVSANVRRLDEPGTTAMTFAGGDFFWSQRGAVYRLDQSGAVDLVYDGGAPLQLRVLQGGGNTIPSVGGFSGAVAGDVVSGGYSVVSSGAQVTDLVGMPFVYPFCQTSPCRPALLAATDKGLFFAPSGPNGKFYISYYSSTLIDAPDFFPVQPPGISGACDGGAPQTFGRLKRDYDGVLAASADGGTVWRWRIGDYYEPRVCSGLSLQLDIGPCAACPVGETLVDMGASVASGFRYSPIATLCRRSLADGGDEIHSYVIENDGGCPRTELPLPSAVSAGWTPMRSNPVQMVGVNAAGVPLGCAGACEASLWSGTHTRVTGTGDGGVLVYRPRDDRMGSASYATVVPGIGLSTRSGSAGDVLGTVEELPFYSFAGVGFTTFEPSGLWLAEQGDPRRRPAYFDRSSDVPVTVISGNEGTPPVKAYSDIAYLPDGGHWLLTAADDRVWATPLASVPAADGGTTGGKFLRVPIKMVPLPSGQMEAITAWGSPGGALLLSGYLITQQRLFRYRAFSTTQWIPDEIRLPAGAEPLDLWMDEGRGRVGTQDGRVYSLPIPIVVAPQLPEIAPRVLDYAEACGTAAALSSTALYLLRADQGSAIGRWERVPLEQLHPSFPRLGAHLVAPLYVERTATDARLLVFSTSGAVTTVRFSCP